MAEAIPGGTVVDGVFVPEGLTIYDVTSPSDRAHRALKGETPTNVDDTEATKVARAKAFGGEVDRGDTAKTDDDTPEGVTPEDGAGHPQTDEEAQAAEEARRDGFSESELEEAEARDARVADEDPDDDIPNVGSQDPDKDEG